MKKIYITGAVGSGKTTLARKLASAFGIPFYELDAIVRVKTPNGRKKRTAEEMRTALKTIDQQGMWIIEGVNRPIFDCLFNMADQIIFLDTHYFTRFYRITLRYIKQKLSIEKSHYEPNMSMLKSMYIWSLGFEKERKNFQEQLENHNLKLTVLKSSKDIRNFIDYNDNLK